jgi:hypothetical protein
MMGIPQSSNVHSIRYSTVRDINHCDRCITLLSDTDMVFALLNLFTHFLVHFG